jgi:L-lactate dehydrogenase complex protein LldG
MNARELMLGRVRAAITDVPADEAELWDVTDASDAAAAFNRRLPIDSAQLSGLFAQRAQDYCANVTRCTTDGRSVRAAITDACARHGATSLVVPSGFEHRWLPSVVRAISDDPPLSWAQLDAADGVITGCAVAIAQTGTVVLDSGADQGRRALTLIPDLHICVVMAPQIVSAVPEALTLIAESVTNRRAPLTLISGPSATSDIELARVEGVHGPRRLEILIAG